MKFAHAPFGLLLSFVVACSGRVPGGDQTDNATNSGENNAQGGGGAAGAPSNTHNGGAAGAALVAGHAGSDAGGGGDQNNGGDHGVSRDAGVLPDADSIDSGNNAPANWVPAIVGVGYSGVRIRSTDNGRTWDNLMMLEQNGGDDNDLLRAVAYGNGRWGTGGWRYFTSVDGVNWTEAPKHPCGGGIVDGLAFGAGRFVATCGNTSFVSPDGLTWQKGGTFNAGGHPKVVFGGGKFATFGDAGQVFASVDGVVWTSWAGMNDAAACDDTIKSRAQCGVPANGATFNGVWLRGFTSDLGGEGIFRSTDGKTWTRVSQTSVEAFAFGFVPP